jgi:hypothetical protein
MSTRQRTEFVVLPNIWNDLTARFGESGSVMDELTLP